MITVKTSDPAGLLKAIYAGIDDDSIRTWDYDKDKDFTHNPTQWNLKAWLRPSIPVGIKGEIRFYIITSTFHENESQVLYGVYHGRFIEMLLNHFDKKFTSASATAMPVEGDIIGKTPAS